MACKSILLVYILIFYNSVVVINSSKTGAIDVDLIYF